MRVYSFKLFINICYYSLLGDNHYEAHVEIKILILLIYQYYYLVIKL